MIDDLNRTLKKLLEKELPITRNPPEINISFVPPYTMKTVEMPAIDLFLYDLREDLEVRHSDLRTFVWNKTDPTGCSVPTAPNVRCSYLITAWSNATDAVMEEHTLLGRVIKALYRNPILPEDVLVGALQNLPIQPRAFVLQPSELKSMGEFWQAMGDKPRPSIHYSVTMPFAMLDNNDNVGVVKTVETRKPHADKNLEKTLIGPETVGHDADQLSNV